MGDFNMKFLKDWNSDLLQDFRDTVGKRLGDDSKVSEEKAQFLSLINLCDKWHLEQSVKTPTHNDNILDLILTNLEDLISEIKVEVNIIMSDHNTITSKINLNIDNEETNSKTNFCYSEVQR